MFQGTPAWAWPAHVVNAEAVQCVPSRRGPEHGALVAWAKAGLGQRGRAAARPRRGVRG